MGLCLRIPGELLRVRLPNPTLRDSVSAGLGGTQKLFGKVVVMCPPAKLTHCNKSSSNISPYSSILGAGLTVNIWTLSLLQKIE